MATVQFHKIEDFGKPLKRGQFYAVSDTRPSAEMQDALRWFEQGVAAKSISLNEEQVGQYMETNGERVLFDEVQSVCGYKWKEENNVTKAMVAVGRLAHKGVTKTVRGIDDFVGHPVLQNVVASIDPIYGATKKHDDELEPAGLTM